MLATAKTSSARFYFPPRNMAFSSKTRNPWPGTADAVLSPALMRALFLLSSALTYEDFADALDAFLEVAVPHDSRALKIGFTDFSVRDYTLLLPRYEKSDIPGAIIREKLFYLKGILRKIK
jgi:hypothetical protein